MTIALMACVCVSMFSQNETETQNSENGVVLIGGHQYVDLGLPSGMLWATCNVGANNPSEYGEYFAWAEVSEKDDYSVESYKWCKASVHSQKKYCTNKVYGLVDNKSTLDAADDAATVNWGSECRMPSYNEVKELMEVCSWIWTSDYDNTGVAGYVVTGSNGNSIFIPASGYRCDGNTYLAGSYGYLWSSSLGSYSNCDAMVLNFKQNSVQWHGYGRHYGQPVRAVAKKI